MAEPGCKELFYQIPCLSSPSLPRLLQTTNVPVFCVPGTTDSWRRTLLKLGQLVTLHHPRLPALLGCPRAGHHNPKKLVCWWWMGTSHNLTTKHKSLRTWISQSTHGSKPVVSAASLNKMPAVFFFKGKEDREIKRKHQANILLSSWAEVSLGAKISNTATF